MESLEFGGEFFGTKHSHRREPLQQTWRKLKILIINKNWEKNKTKIKAMHAHGHEFKHALRIFHLILLINL